jgi:hypothetical protein
MEKIFTQFTRGGIKFLTIPNGSNNIQICDESGANYGSYFDIKSFDGYAEKYGGIEKLKLDGKIKILFQII